MWWCCCGDQAQTPDCFTCGHCIGGEGPPSMFVAISGVVATPGSAYPDIVQLNGTWEVFPAPNPISQCDKFRNGPQISGATSRLFLDFAFPAVPADIGSVRVRILDGPVAQRFGWFGHYQPSPAAELDCSDMDEDFVSEGTEFGSGVDWSGVVVSLLGGGECV